MPLLIKAPSLVKSVTCLIFYLVKFSPWDLQNFIYASTVNQIYSSWCYCTTWLSSHSHTPLAYYNISPDFLMLDSQWDALQNALLDVLLDSLPDILHYTSPFQADFEQSYALPNLTKLLFYFWLFWVVRCTHRSYWCLLNAIINMSSGEKIEFWKFFPTAHINVCLEQTSIWAVSGSHRSTAHINGTLFLKSKNCATVYYFFKQFMH